MSASVTPQVGRLTARWHRGEVIGAVVLAFAGVAWFGWAQQDPPSSWVPYLIAGSVLNAVALVCLVGILLTRRAAGESVMAQASVRRGYWITVAVEVVLIVAGNVTLGVLGHAEYAAAWTLFVVGVHFVPLARVMRAPAFEPLGYATAALAVVAVVLALLTSLSPSAGAGVLAGLLFLGYAVRVLVTGLRA